MNAEPPSPPSAEVLEEIREHLKAEHGRDLEPRRDVFWQGNKSPDALITHRPQTSASAEGFWCSLCPGKAFLSAAEPGLDEGRIAYLARADPELEGLLAEVDDDQRAELVKARQSEQNAAALLARQRRRERLRTVRPQPSAEARRQAAQAFLLSAYEELGNVENTIWSLLDLKRTDAGRYRQIMGTDQLFAPGTVQKYWQEIPLEEREAAKQRYLDRQS